MDMGEHKEGLSNTFIAYCEWVPSRVMAAAFAIPNPITIVATELHRRGADCHLVCVCFPLLFSASSSHWAGPIYGC